MSPTVARNVDACPRRAERHFCAHSEATVCTAYGPRKVVNRNRHIPLCGNPGLCECMFLSDAEFAACTAWAWRNAPSSIEDGGKA